MSHNNFLVINIIPHEVILFPDSVCAFYLCVKPWAGLQLCIGGWVWPDLCHWGTIRTHFKLNNYSTIPQGHFVPEVTCCPLSLLDSQNHLLSVPSVGRQSSLRVLVSSSLSVQSGDPLFLFVLCCCKCLL